MKGKLVRVATWRSWRWLMALSILLGGLGGLGGLAGRAAAQALEFPVDNLRLAPSPGGYYVTDTGHVLGHLEASGQIYAHYAHRPLQLVDEGSGDRVGGLINSRYNLDLLLAMGFFDVLELGVVVPVTVAQSGGALTVLDRPSGDLSAGLRDIRVVPKIRLVGGADNAGAVAIALPVSFPTGSRSEYLGEDGVTFAPQAIFSVDTQWFDMAMNVGYRLRRDQSFEFTPSQPNVAIGSQFFGSLGAKVALGTEHVELVSDLFASVATEEQDAEEVPVELLSGLRFHFADGFVANAGAGPGLTRGLGAPAFRVLLGIGYVHTEDPDPDGDGILGDDDACPLQPEDFDSFEDVEGCPDPDNDKDGVLDSPDRCPNEPEDRDGFEDENGCPDPDNDADRIPDVSDKCPMEPEDVDQFEDADGCPEADNDQDGILDGDDQCPVTPEDRDGFEDADGCPDPDNDKDGNPDTTDKCPMEPEDVDQFEDADGCPDPDNDQDGILDPVDQCPMEPETINGNEDEDGCPDRAKGPVQIEHGKITTPPVFFAVNKDVILAKSFPILEQVARTFIDNPWVKRVRIEGHTDDRGDDDFNLDLSRRRAESVRRFLVERGVDPERLDTAGFGEQVPVASNKSKQGRAKNRRVEFVILDPPQSQNPVPVEP